jgi:MoxR-like ATPase
MNRIANAAVLVAAASALSLIPERNPLYVPCGNYEDIKQTIAFGRFSPIFVTGLSGNGKTTSVEQACADLGRECIRVNITCETDEDDLLGGFRLVNGETVWHDGPVILAMERGAVLLLDEVDLASHKIMCLQPVLEGKAVFLKKINRTVTPAKGFTIIATANTKGQGSDSGKFIGTAVLNEAFLDRFATTMVQEFPDPKVEATILNKLLKSLGKSDTDFTDKLVKWANGTRQAFEAGTETEVISTRRLVHAVSQFAIFGDRLKAVSMVLARFDDNTRRSFRTLYCSFDQTVVRPTDDVPEPVAAAADEDEFETA